MKKTISLVTTGVLLCQSLAFAQATAIPVVGGGRGGAFVGNAGNYNINSNDVASVLNNLLNRASVRQTVDREYLLSSVQSIQKDYEVLLNLVMTGDMARMSQASQNGQTIAADVFFATINKVNAQAEIIRSRLSAFGAITKETLPSVVSIDDGTRQNTLRGYGDINFAPIVQLFESNVAGLLNRANNYMVKVQFRAGIPEVIAANSGTTLNPQFSQPTYSSQEIEQMRQLVNRKRSMPRSGFVIANNHAIELRKLVQDFITNYGTNERFRVRDDAATTAEQGRGNKTVVPGVKNDDYYTARDRAFKGIVEAFWMRSYLRTKHGMRIGAIQPRPYVKRAANVDKFLVATEELRNLRSELAMTETDLQSASENIRMVLKVVDERSTAAMGRGAASSWLVRANSVQTFIGGRRPSAEAIFMISQLIAGEIREESLLIRSGGLANLREFYRGRYQSTQQNTAYFTGLKCAVDSQVQNSTQCQNLSRNAFSQDVNAGNGVGVRGIFAQLNASLLGMAANINEANEIEQRMLAAMASQKSFKAVADRANDL